MKTIGLMLLAWGISLSTTNLLTPGNDTAMGITAGALIGAGALFAGKEWK